jgi:hypothetical protein
MPDTVNEKSSSYITASFLDRTGAVAQPDAAKYKLHDTLSGCQIRGATSVCPTLGVVTITFNAGDNTMINSALEKETRQVTLSGSYGSNEELHGEFFYDVFNLDYA